MTNSKSKIRISSVITAIIILFLTIFIIAQISIIDNYKFKIDTLDDIFESCFAKLCNNLNISYDDESARDEWNKDNAKYSYLIMTVFPLTSYSDCLELHDIIYKLYNICSENTAYDSLDYDTIRSLNRLSQNLTDNILLDEVHDTFCNIE